MYAPTGMSEFSENVLCLAADGGRLKWDILIVVGEFNAKTVIGIVEYE